MESVYSVQKRPDGYLQFSIHHFDYVLRYIKGKNVLVRRHFYSQYKEFLKECNVFFDGGIKDSSKMIIIDPDISIGIGESSKVVLFYNSKPAKTLSDEMIVLYHQKLTGYSFPDHNNVQVLFYKRVQEVQDCKFRDLTRFILECGDLKQNRTGVDTKSLFAQTLTFDVSDYTLPLTTLRKIPFKFIIHELLWMIQGKTDSKLLEAKNINIWKGNTSKEFISSRGLDLPEGELGPAYGFQFRNYGGVYNTYDSERGGIDQIRYLDDQLKKRDFSRRLVINLWNPRDIDRAVLPPCHFVFMLNHTREGTVDYLDATLVMRSSDELARSWNVSFYTILLFIYCKRHNYLPRKFCIFMNDAHVYTNHIESVKLYNERLARPFPMLHVSDSVTTKTFNELTVDDFKLVGYFPHPNVKMDMVV